MALDDVILDNEHDAFDGANEEVEVSTKAPSNVASSLSTVGPTPKRRRMLPRITKYMKKGPPEGMVSIDEVPITQLEAMAHGRGQFEDDVGEYEDEEEEVAADHSAEKLRLETEANATQDSNYTPEGDPTPSTVGSNSLEVACEDDMEVMRRIRKPSAKAIAAAGTVGATVPVLKMASTIGATETSKRLFKQPIAMQSAGEGAIHWDPKNHPDPKDYMKIFPRPDFNVFKVENLKICMKANNLIVGKGGRKEKMVAQCVQRWNELHPMKDVRKVDQALDELAKKAIDVGLAVAKGKSSLSQWNAAQEIARESIRTGRPLMSFLPPDVSPPSASTSSNVDRPPSKSTSSKVDRPPSKSTSNEADRRSSMDRESFRILLDRTTMEADKTLEAESTHRAASTLIDLSEEEGGTPSIEQTFAQLEDELNLPPAKRGRWSESNASTPVDVVRQALSNDGGEVAPTPNVDTCDMGRVLSAEMSTHSAQSTQSNDSDGGDFDSASFLKQVKR